MGGQLCECQLPILLHRYIAQASGLEAVMIDDLSADDVKGYDGFIIGAPTHQTACRQPAPPPTRTKPCRQGPPLIGSPCL